jgi:hypothetical protein
VTHHDDPDPNSEESLTPEQDEAVRRVLGSLPPEGPAPEAVVARLDARLTELVAGRDQPVPSAADAGAGRPGDREAPVDLAARRRRGRWRPALVAAASVAVLGVGLGTVVDDLSTGGTDAASDSRATSQAESDDQTLREAGPGAATDDSLSPDAQDESASGGRTAGDIPRGALLTLAPQELARATLARDVRRLVSTVERPGAPAERVDPLQGCVVPALGEGDRLAPVTLDGERAVLVLQPPSGATRVAEVYPCDGGDVPLATTTVAVR